MARQGFKAKEGTIDAEGKVSGDIKFLEDCHVSALAPVGMVVNIAAPRIELTMNPLKMLSDISGKDNLQKQIGDAAKKVGKIADFLKKRTLSAETNEQLKSFPFTMGKVADAMKSDAAAYIQVVTTSAVSNSGMSVRRPMYEHGSRRPGLGGREGGGVRPERRQDGEGGVSDGAQESRSAQQQYADESRYR
jgi:hypothetical protein